MEAGHCDVTLLIVLVLGAWAEVIALLLQAALKTWRPCSPKEEKESLLSSEASADPNIGKAGLTPLMIAASSGQLEVPFPQFAPSQRDESSNSGEAIYFCQKQRENTPSFFHVTIGFALLEVARMLVNCGAAATGACEADGRSGSLVYVYRSMYIYIYTVFFLFWFLRR